ESPTRLRVTSTREVSMRRTKFLIVGMALLAVAAGGSIGRVSAKSQDVGKGCSLPSLGTFSVGWVQLEGNQYYRCLETFDSSLRPSGFAWVKVQKATPFVVQE